MKLFVLYIHLGFFTYFAAGWTAGAELAGSLSVWTPKAPAQSSHNLQSNPITEMADMLLLKDTSVQAVKFIHSCALHHCMTQMSLITFTSWYAYFES